MIPHEFSIGDVYLPPIFVVAILGVIAASLTGKLLNHYQLSKYFYYPPLVVVALSVIYTVLLGLIIPF